MLDYSLNDFQRSCFIIGYDIDPNDKTIMVNYANKKSDILPYTVENEKMILSRMRTQIVQGNNFYTRTTAALKKLKFRDRIYKILFTVLLGLTISLTIKSIISCLLFLLLTLPANIHNYRIFKRNSLDMWLLSRTIKDYEKNIDFVNNSKHFSNEKIMKPYTISNAPSRVKDVITMGVVTDNYDEIMADKTSSSVLVDFQIFDNPNSILNETDRNLSLKYENDAIERGYKDVSNREIPFINENTIDELSYSDLNKVYKLTTSKNNNDGKVLVKTIKFNKKN